MKVSETARQALLAGESFRLVAKKIGIPQEFLMRFAARASPLSVGHFDALCEGLGLELTEKVTGKDRSMP